MRNARKNQVKSAVNRILTISYVKKGYDRKDGREIEREKEEGGLYNKRWWYSIRLAMAECGSHEGGSSGREREEYVATGTQRRPEY